MPEQNIHDELILKLAELERDGLRRRRRTLDSPCGPLAHTDGRAQISFCSNDYLGLATDPAVIEAACVGARQWGVGAGAAHLVSGHLTPHEQLEQRLATFTGFARALLFTTGYMANIGMVTALLDRGGAIFADRLNHASLIDAALLSRAEHHRYPHADLDALERLLAGSPARRKMILTDAVFSMDGDVAPLPDLLRLAERYDAWLAIDDAHGFGVLGKHGAGSLSHFDIAPHPRIIYMGTLGKAAGAAGAFVAGSPPLIEWLLQRARTYIFTTASSPVIAHALLTALTLIEDGDARRTHLQSLIRCLREGLESTPWRLLPSQTAIQPLIVGDNHAALRLAEALFERGLWVPVIRPPTVPAGTARLRISLSAAHSEAQVRCLTQTLQELA